MIDNKLYNSYIVNKMIFCMRNYFNDINVIFYFFKLLICYLNIKVYICLSFFNLCLFIIYIIIV